MGYVNLDNLNPYFEKGVNFSLTDEKYEALVKNRLPKNKSYLINRSALSSKAKEYGFKIEMVISKQVYFTRIEE